MKELKKILLLLFVLFVGCTTAFAKIGLAYKGKLCEYEVVVKFADESKNRTLNYSIYYTYDTTNTKSDFEFNGEYIPSKKDSAKRVKKTMTRAYGASASSVYLAFSDSSIYETDLKEFSCPKYMINGAKPYQVYKPGGAGTITITNASFSSISSNWSTKTGPMGGYTTATLVSAKKTYDAKTQVVPKVLKSTLEGYKNEIVTKERICSKEFDANKLTDEYMHKFKENLAKEMFGNSVGYTIIQQQWDFPKSFYEPEAEKYRADLQKHFTVLLKECIKEAETPEEQADLINYEAESEAGFANYEITITDFGFKWDGPENCEGFLGDPDIALDPAWYLQLIFKIVKYVAVILAIVLSIIDFVKAITAQDKDALNKAIQTAIKRLILTVLLFFLPILVNFVLGIVGAYDTCGIGVG